jgi:antitoxin component YwqK of YwqJK toxin-antitoxin module
MSCRFSAYSLVLPVSVILCAVACTMTTLPSSETRPPDFTGTWVTQHPNGERKSKFDFLNGNAHGKHYLWDASGNLEREGWYWSGAAHGAWSFWDSDHRLVFVRINANGTIVREIHYDNNLVVADGEYRNDSPWNGSFRDWDYRNGTNVVYHELREGRPWSGWFWTPLPSVFPTRPRSTEIKRERFENGKIVSEVPLQELER